MHHFHYVGQNLHCESVDLAEVARLYGTPTYVTRTMLWPTTTPKRATTPVPSMITLM